MREIISNLGLKISTTFSFYEEGIVSHQYYDIDKNVDQEGKEFKINYKDLETSFFESSIVKRNGKECLNPTGEDIVYLRNDLEGLKKFVENLEKRIDSGVKNYNEEFDKK
jgi:hypothetical protein